jgi:hypothetical protein
VDKVAGFLEVTRTDDTHEIVVSHPPLKSDANGLSQILISPRHARYLANLLIEHATYAEAEAAGRQPESRPYRRLNHTSGNDVA